MRRREEKENKKEMEKGKEDDIRRRCGSEGTCFKYLPSEESLILIR